MEKSNTRIAFTIGTFFGVGYAPFASGTVATVAGLALVALFHDFMFWYAAILLILLASGWWASGIIEKQCNEQDPGIVVVDEVVGIMIALAGIPLSWSTVIIGFFLFRALDMFKIYPVNRMEALKGGMGVMMDDVAAGVMTNIVLSIAVRWAGII